jgi:nucleotide-binding universal stress UspA family protein
MRRIIACTDGSRYAPSVYAHAAWAASRLSTSVEVLHVHDRPADPRERGDLSGAIGSDASEDLLDEMLELDAARARLAHRRAEAVLQDAARVLGEAGVRDVSTTQRHDGLAEAIHEAEARIELLVIGKRGEDADMAKGHLGSNLERVLRISEWPVLVASHTFRPIGTAIIAFDGQPSSLRAIEYLVRLPLLHGVTCHLVTAGEAAAPSTMDEAKALLEQACAEVHVETLPGDAREVVPAAIMDQKADLLVMGAYGHGRLHGMFLGSVTTALLQACRVPTLVLR